MIISDFRFKEFRYDVLIDEEGAYNQVVELARFKILQKASINDAFFQKTI